MRTNCKNCGAPLAIERRDCDYCSTAITKPEPPNPVRQQKAAKPFTHKDFWRIVLEAGMYQLSAMYGIRRW